MTGTPSVKHSLASNAVSLFSAHFAAKALSFGLIVVLPRYVTDAELGGYFLAIAVTNLLGVLAELGMRDPLIRELHLRPETAPSTLGVALAFRSTMSVVVLTACALAVVVNRYPPEIARLVALLGVAEVLNGIAQLFYFVFRARERMDIEAVAVVLERCIVVVLGGAFIVTGIGRMTLLGTVALGAAAANAVVSGIVVQRRFARIRLVFARQELKRLWGLIAPFALANVLSLLYFRLDTILLERWSEKGASAVAWYGIAYSWVMALTIFPGAVLGAAFPHLARLASPVSNDMSRRHLDVLYTRAWKLMLSTGPAIAIVTAFTATDVMTFIYPSSLYPPGTVDAALGRLAWVEGLLFLSAIVSNTLRAMNRRRTIVALVGATVVINVAANAWAIPRYEHVGAATALIVSEAFFVVAGVLSLRGVARLTEWRFVPKLVAAWVVLVAVLNVTETWTLPIRLPVACGIYVLCLLGARVMRRGDWTLAIPIQDEP
jgi:O-antigen/teichoic acid export membrane protein